MEKVINEKMSMIKEIDQLIMINRKEKKDKSEKIKSETLTAEKRAKSKSKSKSPEKKVSIATSPINPTAERRRHNRLKTKNDTMQTNTTIDCRSKSKGSKSR